MLLPILKLGSNHEAVSLESLKARDAPVEVGRQQAFWQVFPFSAVCSLLLSRNDQITVGMPASSLCPTPRSPAASTASCGSGVSAVAFWTTSSSPALSADDAHSCNGEAGESVDQASQSVCLILDLSKARKATAVLSPGVRTGIIRAFGASMFVDKAYIFPHTFRARIPCACNMHAKALQRPLVTWRIMLEKLATAEHPNKALPLHCEDQDGGSICLTHVIPHQTPVFLWGSVGREKFMKSRACAAWGSFPGARYHDPRLAVETQKNEGGVCPTFFVIHGTWPCADSNNFVATCQRPSRRCGQIALGWTSENEALALCMMCRYWRRRRRTRAQHSTIRK